MVRDVNAVTPVCKGVPIIATSRKRVIRRREKEGKGGGSSLGARAEYGQECEFLYLTHLVAPDIRIPMSWRIRA